MHFTKWYLGCCVGATFYKNFAELKAELKQGRQGQKGKGAAKTKGCPRAGQAKAKHKIKGHENMTWDDKQKQKRLDKLII